MSTGLRTVCVSLLMVAVLSADPARPGKNLVTDPSFEEPREKDRWGRVFTHWSGWIYEGECEFRVSDLSHSGKHSLVMVGGNEPKIRAWPEKLLLEPGRYRITAYLRGLDIGANGEGQSTEFMFDEKYLQLNKQGTFGWSKLTYVGDITQRRENGHPSFGLMAPGYFWVDDVCVEKVADDTPLTPQPRIGEEEKAIAPPGRLDESAVRCPECGCRNLPEWKKCYACGWRLEPKKAAASGPALKRLASFEDGTPFEGGTVVPQHATHGVKALRLDEGAAVWDGQQNWSGYEYWKADVFTEAKKPLEVTIEIRDRQTRDYWTRVNYTTVVPPGASTLIIPTALYVGEKARPGRALLLDGITRLVVSLSDKPEAPLYLDNLRLERDTEPQRVQFDGLWAFDVGPSGSPLMDGFQPLDARKTYSKGRGYGWKNAHFWRAFDALQPDPLYRDFLCVEKGGLALDVPDGKYHVIVNMDSPSGFWGEYQIYRRRALIVEGSRYEDTMDLASFKKRYFRNWDKEDLESDDTFEKYQLPYFEEKHVTAWVRDGQLNIDFEGENWACCVSSIIVYPDTKAEQGRRFLDFVQARRRFHFNNAFKRVLHPPSGEVPKPNAEEKERGFLVFARAGMEDVYANDRPRPGEGVEHLSAAAFAGEYEPVTVSLLPLRDLGSATLTVGDLTHADGTILPSKHIEVGYIQHRLARVTEDGGVYTIAPRYLLQRERAPLPMGLTRTFWLTIKTPPDARPGVYLGTVKIQTERGGAVSLPLELTVRKGTLDAVDIPAGPFSYTIDLPWFPEESADWNRSLAIKSLRKLREYGFTTVSGLPIVTYQGFKDGVPQFDFSQADAQMRMLKANGFRMPVVSYCPFNGLNLYEKDEGAMNDAGFKDYSAFLKVVFGAVQRHADAAGWLPVYWNIGDEPVGDDVERSAENAEAYRKAFPKGPPFFTAASSFTGGKRDDPHFRLSRALHVADWNSHDEAGAKLLREAGGNWAFYNGGDRWTYGFYLYKAAKQFGMKFRVAWHWNAAAGDPFYGLDCREDDAAWCCADPHGNLIATPQFERLREGLDDYRRLLTLARLAKEKRGTPAAEDADKLFAELLASFRLGDREMKEVRRFKTWRARLDAAIERLQ